MSDVVLLLLGVGDVNRVESIHPEMNQISKQRSGSTTCGAPNTPRSNSKSRLVPSQHPRCTFVHTSPRAKKEQAQWSRVGPRRKEESVPRKIDTLKVSSVLIGIPCDFSL